MAVTSDYKTAMATAQDAAKINVASRPDLRSYGGRLHHLRVNYTMTNSETAGQIVKLCDLPKGAKIISGMSKVTPTGDPGTTLTLDFGCQGDMDCWGDGVVVSAAEKALFDAPAVPAGVSSDLSVGDSTLATETPADLGVYMTFATVSTLSGGPTLVVDLVFTLPE